MPSEIIKRAEVIKRTRAGDSTIITIKLADPYRVRPFATFAVIGESRYAQHVTDAATEVAALQAHDGLVKRATSGA
jgi:hypothetical protein